MRSSSLASVLSLVIVFCGACGDDDETPNAGTGGAGTGGAGTGGSGDGGVGGSGGAGSGGTNGGSGGTGGDGFGTQALGTPCLEERNLFCLPGLTCVEDFAIHPDLPQLGKVPICTRACSAEGDCAGADLVCGTGPDGTRMCVPDCSADGFVCEGDESVACAVADDAACEECGCPVNERCVPDVGCMPPGDVGAPCDDDSHCTSGNCSYYANVCRVAAAAECDETNCDDCWVSGEWSFCSRPCSDHDMCNGGLCLSVGGYPRCFATCAECTTSCSSFDSLTYCDCPGCQHLSPPRRMGEPCVNDTQCASNECLWSPDTCNSDDLPRGCSGENGVCTTTCASDVDCESGTRCASILCNAEETAESCGNRCLPACDAASCFVGSCVELPAPDSQASEVALVCSQKRPQGRRCTEHFECLTDNCQNQICGAQRRANGVACGDDSECRSDFCSGGMCREPAYLGDDCGSSLDCAEGTCCQDWGTCEESC